MFEKPRRGRQARNFTKNVPNRLPNRYFRKIDVGCPCLVIGELIFTLFFILNMASLDSSYRASKSRKNADTGGWKRSGNIFPANIYFCSFFSLLPPLFDKHSGCYCINWHRRKTPNPETFWQRRSRLIRNSCKLPDIIWPTLGNQNIQA